MTPHRPHHPPPLRLLLVELAPDDPTRRFRTSAYPFLMGLARSLGWQASWCALGVRCEPTLRYLLEPGDLKLLRAEVARSRAGAVIINERLQDAQARALAAAIPGRRLIYYHAGEDYREIIGFVRQEFLDADESRLRDPRLIERIQPDFSRRVLNQAPWAANPLVRVRAGEFCPYRRPLARNPFFRGLSLPPGAGGCSFCSAPHADSSPLRDPVSFAVRVVAAALRQPVPEGVERRFEFEGGAIWARLEEFFKALAARRLRGAEFWFSPRVDTLLAARPAISRCLPLLARQGFALRLYTMGLENFSARENLRLNKGISAAQIRAAADFIAATAARWPREFRFPCGNMSMIMFTPWTTLADLRINLRHMSRYPLISGSEVIDQRLQLFPSLPITLLARRDGLVTRKRTGPFYNSGCIVRFDQEEVPWRFARPEVGVLYDFARRLAGFCRRRPEDGPADPRIAALQDWPEGPPDPLPLFRRALAVMTRCPGTASEDQLLQLLGCTPMPARTRERS
ncbi:MAG: hypothetical protein NTY77_06155 [Elusimicrobia bacterium]|nr:hypothetical protein [Elusimicrobiota bacterium]